MISFSQTLVLGSYLFGKDNISTMTKDIIASIFPYIYTYGFNSKIFYKGNYKSTDKIDVIIANHVSTIDFIIMICIIRMFDDRDFYFIFKNEVILYPAIGFILSSSKDIKIIKKLEHNKDNIINNIKNIKNGVIVIFPEGTRISKEKILLSQKFSKDNKLNTFNNVLYPRMKGLWTICNTLNELNKLGNIIDITCFIENFKNEEALMKQILSKELGNTYCTINSYKIPKKYIYDYEVFKKWILKIWIIKDEILNENTDDYKYTELIPTIKSYNYMMLFVVATLFIYLSSHLYIYIPLSFILTYIISYIKYIKKIY